MNRRLSLALATVVLAATVPANPAPNALSQTRLRLRAALAEEARDEARQVVTVGDLALDPRTHRDREVAVLGFPFNASDDGFFLLGDGFGVGPYVAVLAAALPPQQRAELLGRRAPPHIVLLRGRLKEGRVAPTFRSRPDHFAAAESVDLGPAPPGAFTVSDILDGKPVPAADPRAVIAALKADPAFRFADVGDLAAQTAASGQDVGLLAFPFNAAADERGARFQAGSRWGAAAGVTVSMDALPLDRKKELMRLMFPPHLLALKGRYLGPPDSRLEAADYIDLGEVPGTPSLTEAVSAVSRPRKEVPLLGTLLEDDPAIYEGCGCTCSLGDPGSGKSFFLSSTDLTGAWFNVEGKDVRLEPREPAGALKREAGAPFSRTYAHAGTALRVEGTVTKVLEDIPEEESWDGFTVSAVVTAAKGAKTQRLEFKEGHCGCGC